MLMPLRLSAVRMSNVPSRMSMCRPFAPGIVRTLRASTVPSSLNTAMFSPLLLRIFVLSAVRVISPSFISIPALFIRASTSSPSAGIHDAAACVPSVRTSQLTVTSPFFPFGSWFGNGKQLT